VAWLHGFCGSVPNAISTKPIIAAACFRIKPNYCAVLQAHLEYGLYSGNRLRGFAIRKFAGQLGACRLLKGARYGSIACSGSIETISI
jgi:hypothetical protein